jgi:hypothetical protein
MDDITVAFTNAHERGRIFVHGNPGARYLVSLEPGWMHFLVDGEPSTRDFNDSFAEVIGSGLLTGKYGVLIDLVRFTGEVDWGAVNDLHNAIDWSKIDNLHVAYLVRDLQFAPLAKIASAIFLEARHKVFTLEAEALNWLRASRR